MNSSSRGPSLLYLTYVVRAGFPKRCIMAIWQHYETSPLWARLALGSAAIPPSRWFTDRKDPHHLLERGPLETLNKSKESSSQNFWAWKSHRVNQSRPHLNDFQLYRLMKQVRTPWNVQPWGPASCARGTLQVDYLLLPRVTPQPWRSWKSVWRYWPGLQEQNSVCSWGFWNGFIPCQFAMNNWVERVAKNRKAGALSSLFKGAGFAAMGSWYFSEPFGYNKPSRIIGDFWLLVYCWSIVSAETFSENLSRELSSIPFESI